MPYSLTVEPAWVRAVFFGELTAADLRALAAEVRTIERARPVPHNRLNDLSEVSGIQLTYADMFDYIAHRRGQWRTLPLRSALVASSPLSVGFARMFQTLSEQSEVQIFATLEEAEAWLAPPA